MNLIRLTAIKKGKGQEVGRALSYKGFNKGLLKALGIYENLKRIEVPPEVAENGENILAATENIEEAMVNK